MRDVYNGRYLTLTKQPSGLNIELTEEGKEYDKDFTPLTEQSFDEYFDDIRGNSELMFFFNLGEVGLGMTDAPGITDKYYYDDDGSLTGPESADLYYYEPYQVNDFTETLKRDGSVTFNKAGTMAKGGAIPYHEQIKSLSDEQLKRREDFIYMQLSNPNTKGKEQLSKEAIDIASERIDRHIQGRSVMAKGGVAEDKISYNEKVYINSIGKTGLAKDYHWESKTPGSEVLLRVELEDGTTGNFRKDDIQKLSMKRGGSTNTTKKMKPGLKKLANMKVSKITKTEARKLARTVHKKKKPSAAKTKKELKYYGRRVKDGKVFYEYTTVKKRS